MKNNQITLQNYFENTRVSFKEVMGLTEIPAEEKHFKLVFTSEYDCKYYSDGNAIIRISNCWGMVGDCYWLIAGESQKTGGKTRMGIAYLEDFELRENNSWSTMQDLYNLLSPDLIVTEVFPTTQQSNLMIGYDHYDTVESYFEYDITQKGPCNHKIGWGIKPYDSNKFTLIPNLLISGDENTLMVNDNVVIPTHMVTRDKIVFAVMLSQMTDMVKEVYWNYLYDSDFAKILDKSNIKYQISEDPNYTFIFNLKNETIKVKMQDTCDAMGVISSRVEKIAFEAEG